jgi:hypothetical protein
MAITHSYKYYIYLRKSEHHNLCVALANAPRETYRGFQFEPHLLNPEEYYRLTEWAKTRTFRLLKDNSRPNYIETILLDDIQFPIVNKRTVLEDSIYCSDALIKNGPQHISDSGITLFMSEPAKVFRNLEFLIFPQDICLLDLWAMGIPNIEFQPLL